MATICIAGDSMNIMFGMGTFSEISTSFKKAVDSADNLSGAIKQLKTKIDLATVGTDVSSSQTAAETAEKREVENHGALSNAYQKLEEFINDVGQVDSKVAGKIRERKNDFYSRYEWLRPECEKPEEKKDLFDYAQDLWNWGCEKVDKVCTWIKDHWEEIVTIVVASIVVIVFAIGSILTGGLLSAVLAGVAWGVGSQLAGDLIFSAIKGDLQVSSWQEYIGAGIGGAIGGACGYWADGLLKAKKLGKFGEFMLRDVAETASSTIIGQTLSNFTGGEKRTSYQILSNTVFNIATSKLFNFELETMGINKLFEEIGDNFGSNVSKYFCTADQKIVSEFCEDLVDKIPETLFNVGLKFFDVDEPGKIVNHVKDFIVSIPKIDIDINVNIDIKVNIGLNKASVAVGF